MFIQILMFLISAAKVDGERPDRTEGFPQSTAALPVASPDEF
jgi:hypothetical protein